MNTLLEVTRQQLIDKSKKGSNYALSNQHRGKNRYARRTYQRVSSSVATYNNIDMNTFFKKDILTFSIDVKGETDTYHVKLKFGGVLDAIKKALKNNKEKMEFKVVREGVMRVFLYGDVYINCDCPDFIYRFKHWSHVNGYSSDKSNNDPGPGKGIANPGDTKGAGCKHTLCVLANKEWIQKVSATIHNYINYMQTHNEKLYRNVMYPKLYGHAYKPEDGDYTRKPLEMPKGKQQSLRKQNQLKTDKDTIDKANVYGKDKGKFKKGNQSGIRFAKNDNADTDEVIIDDSQLDTESDK